VKIAVDVMGGDHAPREIVRGSLLAVTKYELKVILVGDEEQVRVELGDYDPERISIVHAPEVIEMGEHPAIAVRRKRNSSIVKATQLVKEGAAAALVSAGNTGAVMASSIIGLGGIKGIDRPAIAGVLPNESGLTVLLDVGANVDCKPQQLLQFGIMGYLYAKKIIGVVNPRVGLLSNGKEETKGNESNLAAFPLLQKAEINFIGNVEGRDIFNGAVDVVVCDGFVGNIVLKAGEGLAGALLKMMREEIAKSNLAKMGTVMAGPAFKELKKRLDWTEYGGAPLLGINGLSIICHGGSTAKAIKNAIRVARDSVNNHLVEAIRKSIEDVETKGVGGKFVKKAN